MASAKVRNLPVVSPQEVTLVLSGEEAQRLADYLWFVLDKPLLRNIERALKDVGFFSGNSRGLNLVPEGNTSFFRLSDNPLVPVEYDGSYGEPQ